MKCSSDSPATAPPLYYLSTRSHTCTKCYILVLSQTAEDVRRRRAPVPVSCVKCETEPKQSFEISTWARSVDARERTYASSVTNLRRYLVIILVRFTHAAALEATLVGTENVFKVPASSHLQPPTTKVYIGSSRTYELIIHNPKPLLMGVQRASAAEAACVRMQLSSFSEMS
jgi:hypothetical protein